MEVLIVDESVQIIQRLEDMLNEVGEVKTIKTSVSYAEAIQLYNLQKPHVVLLAISSLEDDSVSFLAQIKSGVSKVSVIILSLNMNEKVIEKCKQLGADYFLDKYWDFEKIPAVVNQIAMKTSRSFI